MNMGDYPILRLRQNLQYRNYSLFHNHRNVFNNEYGSYTNMSVKRPLAISSVFTSVDTC